MSSSPIIAVPGDATASHNPEFELLDEIVAAWSIPGGGKDTLGLRLSEMYGWGHLSCSSTLTQIDEAFPLLGILENQRRGKPINDDIVLASLTIRLFEFSIVRPTNGCLYFQGGFRSKKQVPKQIDLLCRFAKRVSILRLGVSPEVAFKRITENPRLNRPDGDNPVIVRERIQRDSAMADDLEKEIVSNVNRLNDAGYDIVCATLDTSRLKPDQIASQVAAFRYRIS